MDQRFVHAALAVAVVLSLRSAPALADEPTAQPPAAGGRVPYLDEAGQQRYQQYLSEPLPRAFAISEKGAYAAASGTVPKSPRRPSDPKLRALELCGEAPRGMDSECKLYSVDDEIVYGKTADPASFNPAPPGMRPAPATAGGAPPAGGYPAPAPKPRARTRFAANVAIDHQFNAIGTVTFSDGSTANLGDALVGLNAGAAFPLTADGQFEIQGLFGFLFSRINASNGNATFWDFPLEVTGHVNLGPFRLGAGPSLHISPILRGAGFASTAHVDFSTAVGAVGRVEYRFAEKFAVGIHGEWLRLSATDQSQDASRIGGVVSLYL